MSNVRLFWLSPPAGPPSPRGSFVWRGRGQHFSRIVGLLSAVMGTVSPQDPSIHEIRVGAALEPWQRLTAPPHLTRGLSRALTDAALRAAPLLYQPGMDLEVETFEADTDAIALIVELYPWDDSKGAT